MDLGLAPTVSRGCVPGLRSVSVHLATGISRATLRTWLVASVEGHAQRPGDCFRCDDGDVDVDNYNYLLGLYLGDGCISEAARTTALRIACADDYPGIKDACEAAIRAVAHRPTYRVKGLGCQMLTNESADIRGIFTDALDLLSTPWRQNRRNSISVARREAVAALDEFVGPKA